MFDKNKIKVITLDFDGTILQSDKTWLSPRNYHALKECQKKGIYCVPCTGRSADMFPPQFEDGSFRYWFTCFGSRILDTLTGEIIHKHSFTPEQSAEVCRLFEGKGIYCEVAAEGKLLFENAVEIYSYLLAVAEHLFICRAFLPLAPGFFFNDRQTVFHTDNVTQAAEGVGGKEEITKLLIGGKVHRIKQNMVMNVGPVSMCGNGKSMLPLREPHCQFITDFIGFFRRNFTRTECLADLIGYYIAVSGTGML